MPDPFGFCAAAGRKVLRLVAGFGSGATGFGGATSERWFSIGLRLLSVPFLP
jgi:hypothetical protein